MFHCSLTREQWLVEIWVLVYLMWTEKMWVGCGGNVGGNQHISHIITIYCQHPTHKTPIPTIYQLINNFSATFSPKIINVSTNNLHSPHFKINILSTHPHSAHNSFWTMFTEEYLGEAHESLAQRAVRIILALGSIQFCLSAELNRT